MDVTCPSLPPKILVADRPRPNEQTTGYMAAHGCHFVECSLFVLLVIIEVFPHSCAMSSRKLSCIKYERKPVKNFLNKMRTRASNRVDGNAHQVSCPHLPKKQMRMHDSSVRLRG